MGCWMGAYPCRNCFPSEGLQFLISAYRFSITLILEKSNGSSKFNSLDIFFGLANVLSHECYERHWVLPWCNLGRKDFCWGLFGTWKMRRHWFTTVQNRKFMNFLVLLLSYVLLSLRGQVTSTPILADYRSCEIYSWCWIIETLQDKISQENLFPISGFVPIMSSVHLFLNGTWLARSSRLSKKTQKLKMAESVGEEMHLTSVDEDDFGVGKIR